MYMENLHQDPLRIKLISQKPGLTANATYLAVNGTFTNTLCLANAETARNWWILHKGCFSP